jgi:thiol:disulfide interchange protein DsbC
MFQEAPMAQRRRISTLALLTATVLGLTLLAQQPSAAPAAAPAAVPSGAPAAIIAVTANAADPRVAITKKLPGAKIDDVRPSPVPGIFEVTRGADLVYVTADGAHAFSGDLYDLNKQVNLTEARRRDVRAQVLAGIPETQMIVFSPKDPKYTVTVFTDVDCGYCRRLHSEMAKYNELGIRVRYMFFPRSGPDTESWAKADAVWCSADRNDALTRAKRGEQIKAADCGQTPVKKDYEMGQDFGIRGTPAIVLANGEMLPGYLPPALLIKRLQTAVR